MICQSILQTPADGRNLGESCEQEQSTLSRREGVEVDKKWQQQKWLSRELPGSDELLMHKFNFK